MSSSVEDFGSGLSAATFFIAVILVTAWVTHWITEQNRKVDCDSYGATTFSQEVYSCAKKDKRSGS